jgi:hypothetical protein
MNSSGGFGLDPVTWLPAKLVRRYHQLGAASGSLVGDQVADHGGGHLKPKLKRLENGEGINGRRLA